MPQAKPTLTPLPCPFCGEMPVVGPQNPKKDGNAWGYVSCKSAKCAVLPDVRDGEDCADDRGTGAYIDCAIRRWNKRA
jgi:hypothetical protein